MRIILNTTTRSIAERPNDDFLRGEPSPHDDVEIAEALAVAIASYSLEGREGREERLDYIDAISKAAKDIVNAFTNIEVSLEEEGIDE